MKIRKRPVEVEGVLITREFLEDEKQWPKWFQEALRLDQIDFLFIKNCSCEAKHVVGLKVETLNGTVTVPVGEWIIRGVQGELYPCNPEIFSRTYEIIEEQDQGDADWADQMRREAGDDNSGL